MPRSARNLDCFAGVEVNVTWRWHRRAMGAVRGGGNDLLRIWVNLPLQWHQNLLKGGSGDWRRQSRSSSWRTDAATLPWI